MIKHAASLLVFLLLTFNASAETWVSTGVSTLEYDKDRIARSGKSSDVFTMWLRREHRERIRGERVIGVLFHKEINCYEQETRSLSTWYITEDRRLIKTEDFAQRESFGAFAKFYASTVCKESDNFYKKNTPADVQPRWYEFWKR